MVKGISIACNIIYMRFSVNGVKKNGLPEA